MTQQRRRKSINKQADDLRQLDDAALQQELIDTQQELMDVRFRLATRGSENTAQLSQAKRKIARIRTLMTEREAQ